MLREARMLAKLNHANVVSIYDVLEDPDGIYLVMEQVQGRDLRAWLQVERAWREVVQLFVQIGSGLAAAHALGIAHCDVKPENVVVTDARPRLIDFGLAHQRSDTPTHGGTRAYLAPERLAGGGGSAAADQYAFFASLVEAIEGQRPTDGARWERMPAWLEAVARRGLDPDPARRFPDMRAAIAALAPTPMLTKYLGVAAVLLVASLVGVVLLFRSRVHSDDQVCLGAEAQLEGIWTPVARAAMSEAFIATKVPEARVIWSRVEARLDRYTADWVKLRTESCVATRVHKEQSVELLDYSMACFDRQRVSLASVIKVFSEANEMVVKKAERTITELGGLAACVDPVALKQAVPLPATADGKQRLDRLQLRYEELKNLDRRGQYKEAFAASEALIGEVRALDYAPLTVRVLVLRAALQVTLGDLATAEKTLRAAASAAALAHDDKKVAEVWIRVLDLLAQQGKTDEAMILEPVAVTSAERVADDLEIQARLQNTMGGIYLAKARYQEAYVAYEKALAMQRRIGATGNPAMTAAISNFGLAKWYTGDLKGALTDLQEALRLMLAELGPDHSNVAYLRQNIADLHGQLGEEDKATPQYAEVIRIWKGSLGPDHSNRAYPHEQLAVLAGRRREFATAWTNIDEAMRLREAQLDANHPLILQGLTVVAEIGIAENTKQSVKRATQAVARGIAIEAKLGAAGKRHAVYLLESRAKLAALRSDWKAALLDRRTVLELRVATVGANHRDTGYSFHQIGRMQVKLGNLGEADESFVRALEIFDAHPGVRAGDAIAVLLDRAEIKMQQHQRAEAIALEQKALVRAEKADLGRAYDLRFALAKARYATGDKATAISEMRTIRTALPATGQDPLAKTIDAWLAATRVRSE